VIQSLREHSGVIALGGAPSAIAKNVELLKKIAFSSCFPPSRSNRPPEVGDEARGTERALLTGEPSVTR